MNDPLDDLIKFAADFVDRRGVILTVVGYALPFIIVGTVALAVVGLLSLI